jgi:hypothetical protein
MNMNGAEKQSGLREGEGERVGHFGKSNSWFIAGSGDYMRGRSSSGRSGRISSDSPGVQTRRGDGGVRGSTEQPLFLGLPFSACALARPQDSSGSDSFVHPFPLLPLLSFLLPPSNYSLVSSPAGRSFFEKTTRARTRPTHSHKKSRSLPHPNRRYSSTFVCIFPRLVHTLDLHLQMLFLSSYLQIPALIPCMCPICYLFLSFPPILAYLSGFCLFHPS